MQNEKSILYIVSTPIGNLADITFRAIETLQSVDLILCEDTRVTRKLLDAYRISKPLMSYHQRSRISRVQDIVAKFEEGISVALVTDAGTPGISDPGNELIDALRKHFSDTIEIIPIPGPAALTTLAQVAGIDLSRFTFLGFPPNKKGRETYFMNLLAQPYPVIYYDSPYRFLKNLQLLKELLTEGMINVIVGRELTKMFEEIRRGTLEEIIKYYSEHPDKVKGEFVVIVYKEIITPLLRLQ